LSFWSKLLKPERINLWVGRGTTWELHIREKNPKEMKSKIEQENYRTGK